MSEENQNIPYEKKGKRFNKKKNKKGRFFSNAKSFGKKGNFGRGTHIEEDQFKYFIGILEALQKPDSTAEDRADMANNVLEQTKGNEIHLASNQIVCKTLEFLIGFSDEEHLESFFEVFGENFRPICSDPFASHVLQKMIDTAFLRAMAQKRVDSEEVNETVEGVQAKKSKPDLVTDFKFNTTTEFAENHRSKCSEFVQRVSKFLLNNLEDFIWDSCGSHLIRSCIMSLAGLYVPKVAFIKGKPQDVTTGYKPGHHRGAPKIKDTTFEVPSEWTELLKEFPSRLEMWPQFKELPYKVQSSGLVGAICVALAHVGKSALKSFGKKLLSEAFVDVDVPKNNEEENADKDTDAGEVKNEKNSDATEEKPDLPSVYRHESSVRLLETLISVAGPKLLTEIYTKLFEGRVVELAKGHRTNFPIQKLLNFISDKSAFETIFDELVDHMEKILDLGRIGVIGSLSGACLRLNTKQAAFITGLQKTLHCTTEHGADRPKSFFACLLKMKTFEVVSKDNTSFFTLYGSLIIQDILQYNKPIFLVNCILETPPADIVAVVQSPNGSYIADVFLESKFIGEKSREKFIKLFDGFIIDLAIARCGSRVLEKIFDAANEGQKQRIAKELTKKENQLQGAMCGRIIYNKLRLETFKLSTEQWNASWTAKGNKGEELLGKLGKKNKRTAS